MHRKRIVHFRADPLLFQEGTQLVALRDSYRKLVIDVEIARHRGRQRHSIRMFRSGEQLLVPFGIPTAALGPLVEILQFDLEYGRLKRIQPAIDTDRLMEVTDLTPMHTEHRHGIGKSLVVGRDEPPIAKPA